MTRCITQYLELQALVRSRKPRIALVLGSGLGDVADRLDDAVELPFGSIAGMQTPSVAGHRGILLLGSWADVPVLVFAGRLHFYEGHPWRSVVQPIYIAHELGASILITTNAAGGIRDDLQPGALMAIRAHVDCTRDRWWRDPSAACGVAGAPATPQATVYSARLLEMLPLPTGVYAQMTGPSYETPAEIRALRSCGIDAVGMSTAREIQTAHDLGMECAAIACITNKAAGLGEATISHEEVLATGHTAREKMVCFLDAFVTHPDVIHRAV
ncbi:MAG: purine-nucleoside phosphorylase [Planctomycetes bacterium]|nr:purine-nucleoside phosphorylase [Planctomycetota bacterium]